MWVVKRDEWIGSAFNRRKYYEVHTEQGVCEALSAWEACCKCSGILLARSAEATASGLRPSQSRALNGLIKD
jgi:hypothetical protein